MVNALTYFQQAAADFHDTRIARHEKQEPFLPKLLTALAPAGSLPRDVARLARTQCPNTSAVRAALGELGEAVAAEVARSSAGLALALAPAKGFSEARAGHVDRVYSPGGEIVKMFFDDGHRSPEREIMGRWVREEAARRAKPRLQLREMVPSMRSLADHVIVSNYVKSLGRKAINTLLKNTESDD